jgi:hypothetical protein
MLRGFDRDTPMLFVTETASLSERQVINAGAQGLMKKGANLTDELPRRVASLLGLSAT